MGGLSVLQTLEVTVGWIPDTIQPVTWRAAERETCVGVKRGGEDESEGSVCADANLSPRPPLIPPLQASPLQVHAARSRPPNHTRAHAHAHKHD